MWVDADRLSFENMLGQVAMSHSQYTILNFPFRSFNFQPEKLIVIWPNKYLCKNPTITTQQKKGDTLLITCLIQYTGKIHNSSLERVWKLVHIWRRQKKKKKEDKEALATQNCINQSLCKCSYTFYSCLTSLIMSFLSSHTWNRWDATFWSLN